MVLKIEVRSGSSGKVRQGQAWVGSDAPDGMPALVVAAGSLRMPTPSMVVRLYRGTAEADVLALFMAGYAVQRGPMYEMDKE